MTYHSTMTSKGTITIAAPIRKALGIKPGQKVSMHIDKNRQVIIGGSMSVKDFEALRARIVPEIPGHLKGLSGRALHEAVAKAKTADYRDKS